MNLLLGVCLHMWFLASNWHSVHECTISGTYKHRQSNKEQEESSSRGNWVPERRTSPPKFAQLPSGRTEVGRSSQVSDQHPVLCLKGPPHCLFWELRILTALDLFQTPKAIGNFPLLTIPKHANFLFLDSSVNASFLVSTYSKCILYYYKPF